MILRFLILVIVLLSTSCGGSLQEVGTVCAADCQESFIDNDNADQAQTLGFSWFGLIVSNDAPVLRTTARLRPIQRVMEKRKTLTANALTIIISTNILKHLAQKRRLLCHLNNLGGSLLHFLCKLTVWFIFLTTESTKNTKFFVLMDSCVILYPINKSINQQISK